MEQLKGAVEIEHQSKGMQQDCTAAFACELNQDHVIPGTWCQDHETTTTWLPTVAQGNHSHSMEAKQVRDCYRTRAYFCGARQVPWQWRMI